MAIVGTCVAWLAVRMGTTGERVWLVRDSRPKRGSLTSCQILRISRRDGKQKAWLGDPQSQRLGSRRNSAGPCLPCSSRVLANTHARYFFRCGRRRTDVRLFASPGKHEYRKERKTGTGGRGGGARRRLESNRGAAETTGGSAVVSRPRSRVQDGDPTCLCPPLRALQSCQRAVTGAKTIVSKAYRNARASPCPCQGGCHGESLPPSAPLPSAFGMSDRRPCYGQASRRRR